MILETVDLTKSFGAVKAVQNVCLQIEEGEVSSIIGPNGAGKTTLFSLITRQLKSDSGKVLFKGNDITNMSPSAIATCGIKKCFQITSIFPKMSVFENVQVAAISKQGKGFNFFSPAGRAMKEEVSSVLDSVGLSGEASKMAGNLSYGEQKRLEFAIALVTMPTLLLLDEPTAGVSPAEANNLMELVRSLVRERGLTTVFIEHDMNMVFNYSDKIRVMYLGGIVKQGTVQEIKGDPEVQKVYLGEGRK